jgi:steroid 5-alpha reductase family enzyme
MSDKPPPVEEGDEFALKFFDLFYERWVFVIIPTLFAIALGRGQSDLIDRVYGPGQRDHPGISYFIGAVFSTSWWIIAIIVVILLMGLGRYSHMKEHNPDYRFGDDDRAGRWFIAGWVCFYFFSDAFGLWDWPKY